MSIEEKKDEKNPANKGKTLSLKRTIGSGQVRQSFSHGRSKSVLVEKKRKRTLSTDPLAESGVKKDEQKLSPAEQAAREKAVLAAKERAMQEKNEPPPPPPLQPSQVSRPKPPKPKGEGAPKTRAEAPPPPMPSEPPPKEPARGSAARDRGKKVPSPHEEVKKPTPPRTERRRRAGKLTISQALNDEERVRSLASMRRRRERQMRQSDSSGEPATKIPRNVTVPEAISIQELANRMAERAVDVIKVLMEQGMMMTINDVIDADTAQLIAEEMGHSVKRVSEADVETGLGGAKDDPKTLKARPPVVTVMGHVDHGKTSLLDALRKSDIARGEAGGITQHIGAYQIKTASGQHISFLDTPGHAAFTAMRARGAKITDIVILVVAADDGIMPQTIEAIAHARAAKVPIIVAINKMDKEGADAQRIKTDLLQHEVMIEEMGGEVQAIEVSAKKGEGLEVLIEALLLQAELLELSANPDRPAEGVVIEARLDAGRGAVVSVLVERGTLKVGDRFIAGEQSGRVRALLDDKGQNITEATPSLPVEVLGATGTPQAGEGFYVVENEARAREIASYRQQKARHSRSSVSARSGLDQMMKQIKESDVKELAILIKADVQGSAEAISQAAEKLSNEEIRAQIVHAGVGGITQSDVALAQTANALIFGFNVRANAQARELAGRDGITISYYNIIYDLVDDIKAAMSGMLAPNIRETRLGQAEIKKVFHITKTGKVAGCLVADGLVRRGAKVRCIRDDVVVHEGELSLLKHFQDEVKEVAAGQECGMSFAKYQDMKEGDIIECYEVETIARSMDDVKPKEAKPQEPKPQEEKEQIGKS